MKTLLSRARQATAEAAPGRAVLTISAAALATASLAACGGSSTPAASTSSAAPVSASAPATSAAPATSSPAAASSGPAGRVNVCSVLTSAQVASITHDVVEVAVPTRDVISLCSYVLSNSIVVASVAPSTSAVGWAGFSGLVSSKASPAGSATPVRGLGQQAISSSAGVAVQGTKYDYLVVYEKGHAANQLSNEGAMARVMLRDLG
jgi:hypothetical protein